MDNRLLITFIMLNIVNVIIQTVKSLATVKCGKSVAALVNAVFALAEEMKCPFLGCSVGAVVSDTGTIAYEELFRLVDSVMYGVKNKGGHNYVVTTI